MDNDQNIEITLKITIDPNNEMAKIIEIETQSIDKAISKSEQIMSVINSELELLNEQALSLKNLDKALLDDYAKNNISLKEAEIRTQQFVIQGLIKRIKLVIPQ